MYTKKDFQTFQKMFTNIQILNQGSEDWENVYNLQYSMVREQVFSFFSTQNKKYLYEGMVILSFFADFEECLRDWETLNKGEKITISKINRPKWCYLMQLCYGASWDRHDEFMNEISFNWREGLNVY